MNSLDFLQGPLQDRILTALSEPQSSVVFVHVPKTGGTSLQRDLNFVFPDGIHIPHENKEDHWRAAMVRMEAEPVSLIRGHLNHAHLQELAERKQEFRLVTFLRHPVERLVSQYLWAKSKGREGTRFFEPPGSFAEYCARRSENDTSELLVGPVNSAEEAIDRISSRFWFVGLTEFYHLCQGVFHAALGAPYRMRERKNQTRVHAEDLREIDEEAIGLARQKMQIDLAVFDFFHEKWSARINDVVELLFRPCPFNPSPAESAPEPA